MDAGDKAGALVAPLLIDLLVARAARAGGTGRLRVERLSAPLFVLPPAVSYAEEGRHFRLDLAAGERTCTLRIAAGGALDMRGGGSDLAGLFETATPWSLDAVAAAGPTDRPDERALARLLDGEAARRGLPAVSRRRGRTRPGGLGAAASAQAAKVLVPATEQSHRTGAGSLSSDNE